jgi:fatty-acyl-CoA synthase
VLQAIDRHQVDHLCAAPVVMAMLADSAQDTRLPRPVRVLTAGSPPPLAVLNAVLAMGFDVEHVFGITEVSGTPVSCAWQDGWDDLPPAEQGSLRVRQGVRAAMFEGLMVGDADTLEPVLPDGKSAGELMLRGNTVMMGYFKNEAATRKALANGWFRTGDVAVLHANGYAQITDRSKDVIISGGENISSVEIEDVVHGHPAVLHAAVVAQPDSKWGEVPCAFIELKTGVAAPTEQEIISFCRERLAHFKCPRRVIFTPLPKTATGKIQKFRLRQQAGSQDAITRLASHG